MAKLSSDGKYVTVEKGDNLWNIAKQYLGSGSKYQTLAKYNNISNVNYLYIGQKIYLSQTSSGSSSSSSTTSSSSTQVTIQAFGLQSNADGVLFVTWDWSKSNTANYEVQWTYDTGDSVWFIGTKTTTEEKQSTYSIPSNAKKVRVRIKPISKTYTKNNKETSYWTASWSSYKTWTDSTPLETPSTPTVEIEDYKLTASLDHIDINGATQIQFQIYKNDGSSAYKTGKATITTTKVASYSCTVDAGGEYKVRCRALDNGSSTSEWSGFSGGVTTIPAASSGITTIKANSETSVYLEWSSVATAKTYEIEYTTKNTYFDYSDQTSIKSGIEFTKYEITGLESGQEYFFRVRAVNEKGESAWSSIKSVIIGKAPTAPTTWSSTTTVIAGEELILYWVHNSEDNSSQTYAELEIVINGSTKTYTIKNSEDEEEKDKTSTYVIDTSSYKEGTTIRWKVKTAGITKVYGDWSVQRTVNVYAPPTLELDITNSYGNAVETLTSFPLYVYGLPGPNTQTPMSYHLSVIANESYMTTDNVGNDKIVSQGEEVYSEYFDISRSLLVELSPSSIDLENNISYTVNCVVSMDSGLTAEASKDFSVSWIEKTYTPNAEISYDPERYVTHIRPYCTESPIAYYKLNWGSTGYTKSTTVVDESTLEPVYTSTDEIVYVGKLPNGMETYYCIIYVDQNGNSITPIYRYVSYASGAYTATTQLDSRPSDIYTTTGEKVLMGIINSTNEIRYCIAEDSTLVDDITLSVYRREYDGTFVEIGTGLKNVKGTVVTDPHPALDYARYRIVAVSDATGSVSFYDPPGYSIGEVGAIIQWNEAWSSFDVTEDSEMEQPAWTGSLIRLPYNIDVSDSNTVDVEHIEYIGRKHPVSYYGTQRGIVSNWSMEIDKKDRDTLYALRRLMIYMGDVYVREPSGSGYWAHVKVSFSQTHCETTIPVTLNITRVEGGV